jgi:hypothetical protein
MTACASAEPERHVDPVGIEVGGLSGCYQPNLNIGMPLVKPLDSGHQPFRRERGGGAHRQLTQTLRLAELVDT